MDLESLVEHLDPSQAALLPPPPLSPSLLSPLPLRLGLENEGTCAICLDEMQQTPVRELPCKHAFHQGCVEEWLVERSGSCPCCKADVGEMLAGEGKVGFCGMWGR
jgi:hypothetical protein